MTTGTVPSLAPASMVRAANLGRSHPVLSWTPLGTVDAGAIGDVDSAGLVGLRGAGWTLDWWVGAEDRWHHPSTEAAVRQRLVGDAPVVETAMRVPGGDVLHRAYAARASSPGEDGSTWDDSAVVVEIENSSAVPVALALALRPVGLDGAPGQFDEVDSDGPVVRVDGRVAMVLSRTPARCAHGDTGQPALMLTAGDDADGSQVSARRGPDGLEVAFVVPLPHTATVRVLLPRVVEPVRRLRRRATSASEPSAGWSAPPAEAIVSGWEAHTAHGARVELPEPLLVQVVAASQRTLALAASDGFLGEELSGPPTAAARAAVLCEALARSGVTEPLGPLARALARSQRLGGAVKLGDRSDGTTALVHAAAPLLAGGSPGWEEELLGPVAKAVHRLEKGAAGSEAADPSTAEGLARLAPALRSIGQPEVADGAERAAAELATVPVTADGIGGGEGPRMSGGSLVEVAAAVRSGIRSGRAAALVDLVALCRIGEPGAVPDRVDADGVPEGTTGFDPAAVAARLAAVLDVAMVEGVEGPVLLPAWPVEWWGQPVEAHSVRTRWGLASFGVRWHGERPALLWQIDPSAGVDPDGAAPVVTAPSLDPSWRGEGWSGEALLAPVPVPPTVVSIRSAGAAATTQPEPAPDLPPPAEGQSFS